MRGLIAFLRAVRRCKAGTSTIELAAVAPVLAILTVGSIDLAMGFSRSIELEQAAQRSVEMARAAGVMGSSYELMRTEAAQAAAVPISAVRLDRWLECDGTRQQSFDDICGSDQQVARYVSVRIDDHFDPMFGFIAGSEGSIPMKGDAAVRVQ